MKKIGEFLSILVAISTLTGWKISSIPHPQFATSVFITTAILFILAVTLLFLVWLRVFRWARLNSTNYQPEIKTGLYCLCFGVLFAALLYSSHMVDLYFTHVEIYLNTIVPKF